jgi:hypothetical protein
VEEFAAALTVLALGYVQNEHFSFGVTKQRRSLGNSSKSALGQPRARQSYCL